MCNFLQSYTLFLNWILKLKNIFIFYTKSVCWIASLLSMTGLCNALACCFLWIASQARNDGGVLLALLCRSSSYDGGAYRHCEALLRHWEHPIRHCEPAKQSREIAITCHTNPFLLLVFLLLAKIRNFATMEKFQGKYRISSARAS